MRLPGFLRRLRRRAEFGPDERRGFTMVELVTVAMIMGTLVRVATPNLHAVILRSRATEVMGDFEVVRLAALDYHDRYMKWPADAYTGQVPPGLKAFLPAGYTFNRAGYRLDWENWMLPNGLPNSPESERLVGISVVTGDKELGAAVVDLLGKGMAHYTLGERHTFVIERK